MNSYFEIHVGEKVLKLRIRMRDHAELDKLCGGAYLKTISDEETMGERVWEILGHSLYIGLKAYEENGAWTRAQVDDLMDQLVDEGWMIDNALSAIMHIAAVSGFFPKSAAEAISRGALKDALQGRTQARAEQTEQKI